MHRGPKTAPSRIDRMVLMNCPMPVANQHIPHRRFMWEKAKQSPVISGKKKQKKSRFCSRHCCFLSRSSEYACKMLRANQEGSFWGGRFILLWRHYDLASGFSAWGRGKSIAVSATLLPVSLVPQISSSRQLAGVAWAACP